MRGAPGRLHLLPERQRRLRLLVCLVDVQHGVDRALAGVGGDHEAARPRHPDHLGEPGRLIGQVHQHRVGECDVECVRGQRRRGRLAPRQHRGEASVPQRRLSLAHQLLGNIEPHVRAARGQHRQQPHRAPAEPAAEVGDTHRRLGPAARPPAPGSASSRRCAASAGSRRGRPPCRPRSRPCQRPRLESRDTHAFHRGRQASARKSVCVPTFPAPARRAPAAGGRCRSTCRSCRRRWWATRSRRER